MAKVVAFLRRDQLPQGFFHLGWLLDVVHQPDAVAQADAVGVRHNGGLPEHITHNQVGTFAPHAGQGEQGVKILRHLAAERIAQPAHTRRNIPCLAVSQAAGTHDFFNVRRVGGRQLVDAGVLGKQLLHHNVYAGIGTLCR